MVPGHSQHDLSVCMARIYRFNQHHVVSTGIFKAAADMMATSALGMHNLPANDIVSDLPTSPDERIKQPETGSCRRDPEELVTRHLYDGFHSPRSI